MLTPEQVKIVGQVYRRFIENESRGWTTIDDYLEMLDYLDDDQLHREADVIYSQHGNGKVGCGIEHKGKECLAPIILEAVSAILELYKETGSMHPKNKYILQYYLALTQANMIVIED